jgi:hypothetical protein
MTATRGSYLTPLQTCGFEFPLDCNTLNISFFTPSFCESRSTTPRGALSLSPIHLSTERLLDRRVAKVGPTSHKAVSDSALLGPQVYLFRITKVKVHRHLKLEAGLLRFLLQHTAFL